MTLNDSDADSACNLNNTSASFTAYFVGMSECLMSSNVGHSKGPLWEK